MSKFSGRAYTGATFRGRVMTDAERKVARAKNRTLQIVNTLKLAFKRRLGPGQLDELVRLIEAAGRRSAAIGPDASSAAVEVAAMSMCPGWFKQRNLFLSRDGIEYLLNHEIEASRFPRTGLDEQGLRLLEHRDPSWQVLKTRKGRHILIRAPQQFVFVQVQYRKRGRDEVMTYRERIPAAYKTVEEATAAVRFMHSRWEIVSLKFDK